MFEAAKKEDGTNFQFNAKPNVFLAAQQIKSMPIKPEKIELFKNNDPSVLSDKDFKNWFSWWLKNMNTEDYFKYLACQVTN